MTRVFLAPPGEAETLGARLKAPAFPRLPKERNQISPASMRAGRVIASQNLF